MTNYESERTKRKRTHMAACSKLSKRNSLSSEQPDFNTFDDEFKPGITIYTALIVIHTSIAIERQEGATWTLHAVFTIYILKVIRFQVQVKITAPTKTRNLFQTINT